MMKATKFEVVIEIECLSKDSVAGLVYEALQLFKQENDHIFLRKDDGDVLTLDINRKEVTF